MDDVKENAEHATVVDLLRNDLGRISDTVEVKRYRYTEEINRGFDVLYQTSTEIEGKLSDNYINSWGEALIELLPAGSVTGAPKMSTVRILKEIERYDRSYYTGIFGYYDGMKFSSAVSIRFIEKSPIGMVYKTGAGITANSDLETEYQELINKIYVPMY